MMLIFSQMHHSGKLDHPVTVQRTALVVLIANLTSFALGVVGFLVLHIMWPHVISVLWD